MVFHIVMQAEPFPFQSHANILRAFFLFPFECNTECLRKYQPQLAETNNKDWFIIYVTIGHNCGAGTLILYVLDKY